jgi:hypothetical protein
MVCRLRSCGKMNRRAADEGEHHRTIKLVISNLVRTYKSGGEPLSRYGIDSIMWQTGSLDQEFRRLAGLGFTVIPAFTGNG